MKPSCPTERWSRRWFAPLVTPIRWYEMPRFARSSQWWRAQIERRVLDTKGARHPVRAVRSAQPGSCALGSTKRAPRERTSARYLEQVADQPTGQLQNGAFELARGRAAAGATHFKKRCSGIPTLGPTSSRAGRRLQRGGPLERGSTCAREACRLAPKDADYRFRLGLGYSEAAIYRQPSPVCEGHRARFTPRTCLVQPRCSGARPVRRVRKRARRARRRRSARTQPTPIFPTRARSFSRSLVAKRTPNTRPLRSARVPPRFPCRRSSHAKSDAVASRHPTVPSNERVPSLSIRHHPPQSRFAVARIKDVVVRIEGEVLGHSVLSGEGKRVQVKPSPSFDV